MSRPASTRTAAPRHSDVGGLGGWLDDAVFLEDGQVVDESSRTIAPTGAEVTEFHVSKPDGWPAGAYEVAISLDGQAVETRSFTVEG